MRWRKLCVALIIWPFTILNDAVCPLFLCKCGVLATDPLDAGVDWVGWMRVPHLAQVWMDLKEQWEESTWENVYSFVERQLKASIRAGYLCTFVCPSLCSVRHLWVFTCVLRSCDLCVCMYSVHACCASVCVLNTVLFDDFPENNQDYLRQKETAEHSLRSIIMNQSGLKDLSRAMIYEYITGLICIR